MGKHCALYVQPRVTPSPGETLQVRTTATFTDGTSSPETSCGHCLGLGVLPAAHFGDPTSTARRDCTQTQSLCSAPRMQSLRKLTPTTALKCLDTFSSRDERAEAGKGRSVRGHAD